MSIDGIPASQLTRGKYLQWPREQEEEKPKEKTATPARAHPSLDLVPIASTTDPLPELTSQHRRLIRPLEDKGGDSSRSWKTEGAYI
ncbi:hypothetical protein BaRGS_00026331 [Batillaria attramentaria]|uniref:Uncharacterized protein n=1 Tax=Batillaria attramentaria TaxID=370345 RepID=A0ABD0K581_9CAEN